MIPCSVSISSMLFLGTFHKMKKEGEEITAHGFVKQRFFSLLPRIHAVESRKGRKDKRQGKKGGSATDAPSIGSDGTPPDVGALCI